MPLTFGSPRFTGDALLEEILNDPDTGTKKLQPGSPAASVTAVQQALWDLLWPYRLAGPHPTQAEFVDGIYGDVTMQTVTRYKQEYNLRFPPNDPSGGFDGFAGPRTLARLDTHCLLRDGGVAAIDTHLATLQAQGIAASALTFVFHVRGSNGVERPGSVGVSSGFFFTRLGGGVFFLHGNFLTAYLQGFGGATGPLGFPTSEEHDAPSGFREVSFERGILRRDPQTGFVDTVNPLPAPFAWF